jgi:hypothetical protein
MLVPSKTGKFPRIAFSPTNDAGVGTHKIVLGVQVVGKALLPPKAAGCVPVVATAEDAPVRNR